MKMKETALGAKEETAKISILLAYVLVKFKSVLVRQYTKIVIKYSYNKTKKDKRDCVSRMCPCLLQLIKFMAWIFLEYHDEKKAYSQMSIVSTIGTLQEQTKA